MNVFEKQTHKKKAQNKIYQNADTICNRRRDHKRSVIFHRLTNGCGSTFQSEKVKV